MGVVTAGTTPPLSHAYNSTSLIVPVTHLAHCSPFHFLPLPSFFQGYRIILAILIQGPFLSCSCLFDTLATHKTFSRFLTVPANPACQYFETSICASSRKTSTSRLRPFAPNFMDLLRCNNCTCHRRGPFRPFLPVMVPAQSTLVKPSDKNTDFLVASRWIKASMSSRYLVSSYWESR